jgi:hypothetical protein
VASAKAYINGLNRMDRLRQADNLLSKDQTTL